MASKSIKRSITKQPCFYTDAEARNLYKPEPVRKSRLYGEQRLINLTRKLTYEEELAIARIRTRLQGRRRPKRRGHLSLIIDNARGGDRG